jgi:hypothetical protein
MLACVVHDRKLKVHTCGELDSYLLEGLQERLEVDPRDVLLLLNSLLVQESLPAQDLPLVLQQVLVELSLRGHLAVIV